MMPTYTHEKSQEWYQRATEVIPGGIYGHLGPAEDCFMPISSKICLPNSATTPSISVMQTPTFCDLFIFMWFNNSFNI